MLGSFSPTTSVGRHPQEHRGDENQAKALAQKKLSQLVQGFCFHA